MEQDTLGAWNDWKQAELEDEDLRQELETIDLESPYREEEISDRFCKSLAFGTGGLRGLLGVGPNRMNLHTVGQATQGYAQYLKRRYENHKKLSVAIAYDSRIKSKLFAETAARVLAANGIKVFLFSQLAPTPLLSFAVRELKCSGGIVITASHNPAQYNGYKVYEFDGSQITGGAAKQIAREIEKVEVFKDVKPADYETAVNQGQIEAVPPYVEEQYISAVLEQAFGGDIEKSVPIIYTPLNGAGLFPVLKVLDRYGFSDITVVEEQRRPDGLFPTCPKPNPEIPEAMSLGIEYAKKQNADVVLATDPDCDRVGIAVRDGETFRLLSGNEIGILLFEYVCKRRKEQGSLTPAAMAVKTIVTTELIRKIAGAYGVTVCDVLTGFKYVGEKIGELESKDRLPDFVMGIEESHGYLTGTYVRDKDGVNASLLLCEMVGYYKKNGNSLLHILEEIYRTYGYCMNSQYTFLFRGEKGSEQMSALMDHLRTGLKELSGLKNRNIIRVEDYQTSTAYGSDGASERLLLPPSNVLKISWEDHTTVTIRPSGTEPKLKVYIYTAGKEKEQMIRTERKMAAKLSLFVENWKSK